MKPSDAFVGVIDFFSTLVPGAVAAFLLLNQHLISMPSGWPFGARPRDGLCFLYRPICLGTRSWQWGVSYSTDLYTIDGTSGGRGRPRSGSSPTCLSLREVGGFDGLSTSNERVMSGESRILTTHCYRYQRSSRTCSFEIYCRALPDLHRTSPTISPGLARS
jgi:hypothetical protein